MAEIIEIDSLGTPQAQLYGLSEGELRHYYEPAPGLFIAESLLVIGRALDAGYEPVSMLVDRCHIEGQAAEVIARCGDIPVYTADNDTLIGLTGFNLARGALCAMRRRELPTAEEVCRGANRVAVMENVVNPTNVGAMIRSAAALGMDAVLLTDGCSDPLYRRAARVSMGTVFQVPWTYIGRSSTEKVKELGFRTAAMALCEDSVSVDCPELASEERLAVILGTEGEGLHSETIAACDYTVMIPMSHGVDSLNVAAASAVAFWQLGRRPGRK